jgi:predicted DNA-binding ribbon-helix-helix protein
MKPSAVKPARLSVSLNRGDYDALNRVAEENDVSLAWLVRKAVEKFVNSDLQRELFPDQKVSEVLRQ